MEKSIFKHLDLIYFKCFEDINIHPYIFQSLGMFYSGSQTKTKGNQFNYFEYKACTIFSEVRLQKI